LSLAALQYLIFQYLAILMHGDYQILTCLSVMFILLKGRGSRYTSFQRAA
jgi:hypothetical protein